MPSVAWSTVPRSRVHVVYKKYHAVRLRLRDSTQKGQQFCSSRHKDPTIVYFFYSILFLIPSLTGNETYGEDERQEVVA